MKKDLLVIDRMMLKMLGFGGWMTGSGPAEISRWFGA
jgi:hypothetical protein